MLIYYKRLILTILCTFTWTGIWSEEKVFFPLDDRTWKIGYEDFSQDESVIEMVLEDENVLQWSELFRIQSFGKINATAEEFAALLEKTTKENDASNAKKKVAFKWLGSPSDHILETYFLEADVKDSKINEYNLGRILKGKENIYYLLYSSKDKELFEKTKQKWVDRLKAAYIAEAPTEKQKGHWFSYETQNVYEGTNQLPYQPDSAVIQEKEAGFQMTLPTDWLMNKEWTKNDTMDTEYPDTIALLFLNPEQTIYGGVAFFDVKNFDPKTFDPKKRFLTVYQKQNPKVKVLKEGEFKTNEGDLGKLIVIEEDEEIAWVTFFEKNGRIFRVEIWSKKKEYKNAKDQFEMLLSSFHLTEKQ